MTCDDCGDEITDEAESWPWALEDGSQGHVCQICWEKFTAALWHLTVEMIGKAVGAAGEGR